MKTACKTDRTAADRVMRKTVERVAEMTRADVDAAVREYLLEVATVAAAVLLGDDDLLAEVAERLRPRGRSAWYVVGEPA